jgi:hypothetical protein
MSIATSPGRCNCDHAKHKNDPCRNMVDDPRTGLICKQCLEQCKATEQGR